MSLSLGGWQAGKVARANAPKVLTVRADVSRSTVAPSQAQRTIVSHTQPPPVYVAPLGSAAGCIYGHHAGGAMPQQQQAQHRQDLWRKLRETTSDYHGGKYQSHVADRLATSGGTK